MEEIRVQFKPKHFEMIEKEVGDILEDKNRCRVEKENQTIIFPNEEEKNEFGNELWCVAASYVDDQGEMTDYGMTIEGICDLYFLD